ncbi:MAG: hypothetical protein AB4062_01740 [Crocosphaera sp.]
MNIYFLVEGRHTEKKIYPRWLQYYIPVLKKVDYYDEVQDNNYYLLSAKGYPRILNDGLSEAIQDIQETGKYNYLVICVDADEDSIIERKEYINEFILDKQINLGKTELILIIQNRCIETWLLGNRQIFNSKQPQEPPLSDYVNYYDISQNDPELMGKYEFNNHAKFHEAYLKAILKANNLSYSKRLPRKTQEKDYFEELLIRIKDNPKHLQTFQDFINFCDMIKTQLSP